MYLPYVRGRQFELIAFRELVERSILSENIVPIIEPVRPSPTLFKTIEVFNRNNKNIAIIRNPIVGDYIKEAKKDKNKIQHENIEKAYKSPNVINAYILEVNSENMIEKEIDKETSTDNIITISKNKDSIQVYENLFKSAEGCPKYNLIPDESVFRRKIRNNRIILSDRFVKLARNTDYTNNDDEPFSDDHLYYEEDGYLGFSDYSIIGDEYSETGFAPYAVAIHIVYFHSDNSLRIKHFVSDTNDDITDPANKFYEAVGKLVDWYQATNPTRTFAIDKFEEFARQEIYPGLGTVKKLCIMHHVELIGKYLDGIEK